jgi:hypothetical protein
MVQLINRGCALTGATHVKRLLLRRSLHWKILHLPDEAHKSDVLDAIRKVEGENFDGILQITTCSDAQVKIAQITLPVQLGGLGVHFMPDSDGTACDAACLSLPQGLRVLR